MRAGFDNLAVVNNKDAVSAFNRRKPVGNRDGGAPFRGRIEGMLHSTFIDGI